MHLADRRVGIVGGGIGGLATALALRARGAEVIVFERAQHRRREGVALLVWANAMKVLASLGVADRVRAQAAEIAVTEVRNAAGELLSELPIGAWSQRAEMPTVAIRRPALVEALLAKLGPEAIRVDASFTAFAHDGKRVRVRLGDGSEEVVDALIGADGLHSTVRAQLLGDGAPRALRQYAWVGLSRPPEGVMRPGIATASVGRGPRFWAAPLRDGAFWYATLNRAPAAGRGAREVMREAFAGWHGAIGELIEHTDEDDIITTQISDRPPVERWGEGAVTLLGDAAHASTPDLGQGACQAIESAGVLASCLAATRSITDGLRAYEQARIARTATITRLCWLTSVNSTIEAPLLCRARDLAIRFGLRTVARGHLEWILAGQPC